MTKIKFTLLLLLLPLLITAQDNYIELKDSKPFDSKEVWQSTLKSDYAFIWGNTDTRYPKFSIPNKADMANKDGKATQINLIAWRGERVNAQALLYTKTDLQNVSFSISDLRSGRNSIAASAMKIQPVSYVMTDELNKGGGGGCGHRPDPTAYDSTLVADVLNHQIENLTIPAYTNKPVWLSVSVPENAQPGRYRGVLRLNESGKISSLNISLTVVNSTLPKPAEWSIHLDMWQNPYAVARFHEVELWSDAHFAKLKPQMKMLADAGQKVITASIMHKPWNGQTEDHFDSMVTRIKHLDGSWEYRYDVFDKWVEFMMNEVGITEQINCYTMIPWAMSFDYYDVATGRVQFINAQTHQQEYADYWLPFLKDFASHLKSKGWFEKTTIAMDERAMRDMQNAIKLIKEADANYKITLAGNYHEEIEADLYDYCLAFGQNFPEAVKARRDAEGKRSTVYTCCTEPFPNIFTFSAPAEAVWTGWHVAAGNYDGYLRWAFNSWTRSPLQDSRFRTWAAGDTYQVYPDARSSIRFERLIEGIQDVEKIRILRKKYANNPKKLQQLETTIQGFTLENRPNVSTEEQVRAARQLLNKL